MTAMRLCIFAPETKGIIAKAHWPRLRLKQTEWIRTRCMITTVAIRLALPKAIAAEIMLPRFLLAYPQCLLRDYLP